MTDPLVEAAVRVYADVADHTTLAEVLAVLDDCRGELTARADPAPPALLERLARQRLAALPPRRTTRGHHHDRPGRAPITVRTTRLAADVWTVTLCGDLDLTAAAQVALATEVDPPAHTPTHVAIDLSGLTFCDTTGLAALDQAIANLETPRVTVTVTGASQQVRLLLRVAAGRGWLTAGPILAAAAHPDDEAGAETHRSEQSTGR